MRHAVANPDPSSPPSHPAQDKEPNFLVLKIVVAVLGFLLVAGFAVVIGTIFMRIAKSGDDESQPAALPQPVVQSLQSSAAFAESVEVSLPRGARVLQSSLSGSTLIVRYTASGDDEEVLLVDLVTGQVFSRIRLATE